MLEANGSQAPTGEWECMECGYVIEGVAQRRPKECPDCGAPAAAFDFFSEADDDDDYGDEFEKEDERDEYDDDEVDDEY